LTGMIVPRSSATPDPGGLPTTARRVRWHILFRYIRYNGLHRPDVVSDDEPPETVAVADLETGTSETFGHEVVDAAGAS
jgi:hypothetical protein